jgi:uncharacterized protein
MDAASDLARLLGTMEPVLNPGTFVFASLAKGVIFDPTHIIASVREPEGLSVVVSEEDAKKGALPILFRCAWITLTVNSDLHAVGLTAAFSAALGDAGISCNVVAGAYHDHIFVPIKAAQKAMNRLYSLQASAGAFKIVQVRMRENQGAKAAKK